MMPIMLNAITKSVIYAERHYPQCHYAECRYAEYDYALCQYANYCLC